MRQTSTIVRVHRVTMATASMARTHSHVSVIQALQDICVRHRWMSAPVTHVSLAATVKILSMGTSAAAGQELQVPTVRSTLMSATVILAGTELNA